jgi:ABC-type polysaccharide/polyol phosphate export permease
MLTFILVLGSTTYVPVEVLPSWVAPLVEANPLTVALEAMRGALLGGHGWAAAWSATLSVLPFSAVSMAAGMAGFGLALDRERRRGTLGIY